MVLIANLKSTKLQLTFLDSEISMNGCSPSCYFTLMQRHTSTLMMRNGSSICCKWKVLPVDLYLHSFVQDCGNSIAMVLTHGSVQKQMFEIAENLMNFQRLSHGLYGYITMVIDIVHEKSHKFAQCSEIWKIFPNPIPLSLSHTLQSQRQNQEIVNMMNFFNYLNLAKHLSRKPFVAQLSRIWMLIVLKIMDACFTKSTHKSNSYLHIFAISSVFV